jgi:hypothetical protein
MTCPICGKTVTFPAIPPSSNTSRLRLKRHVQAEAAKKWSFNLAAIRAFLGEFEHWNMVVVCLVPFIIVLALLIGAVVIKKKLGSEPAATALAPVVQADPNAWQKMTDLARAEQSVQDQVAVVIRARAAATGAQQRLANLQAAARGRSVDPVYSLAVANSQRNLEAARHVFNIAFLNYQKLGGTVDYSRQLPQ